MASKAEKMRGRLAAIAKDRENFEKQKQELEAQMNQGRANMGKIQKGLRNNEICETPIPVESTITAAAPVEKEIVRKASQAKSMRYIPPKDTTDTTPTRTSNAGTMMGAASETTLIPSGPRVSDWCYTGPLDSSPPVVKYNEVYETIRLLGRGSFGEVLLVKNVEDNRLYADKTIFSEKEADLQSVLREVKCLRENRHPCIIDIHDGFVIANPRILHIIMPYCEAGDLGKVITAARKNKTTVPEAQIIKWSIQIALALHHLHEHNTLHRDLKPCNVMLTEGGELAKVVDLGLAVKLVDGVCGSAAEAGTPLYTPPEMITGEKYSFPTDCWSFGVMLHELLRLDPPFTAHTTTDLVRKILSEAPPMAPSHYSEEIRQIALAFLIKKPSDRLGFAGMLMSEGIFTAKVAAFPQTYRPKALEERMRRFHTKQLVAQIEGLPQSRYSSRALPVFPVVHMPYVVGSAATSTPTGATAAAAATASVPAGFATTGSTKNPSSFPSSGSSAQLAATSAAPQPSVTAPITAASGTFNTSPEQPTFRKTKFDMTIPEFRPSTGGLNSPSRNNSGMHTPFFGSPLIQTTKSPLATIASPSSSSALPTVTAVTGTAGGLQLPGEVTRADSACPVLEMRASREITQAGVSFPLSSASAITVMESHVIPPGVDTKFVLPPIATAQISTGAADQQGAPGSADGRKTDIESLETPPLSSRTRLNLSAALNTDAAIQSGRRPSDSAAASAVAVEQA